MSSGPGMTVLTVYPFSRPYLHALEERLGGPVVPIILSELRRASVLQAARTLRSIGGARAYAATEDASGQMLLPLLRIALSLTRARHLAWISPDVSVTPFGRAAAAAEGLRLVGTSLAGLWALALCRLELARLTRRARARVPTAGIRSLAYLKTTLWLGVKAGGSVGHVAGVVNAMSGRLESVRVLAPDRPPLLDDRIEVTTIDPPTTPAFPHELNHYRYQRRFARAAMRDLRARPADAIYQRLSLASYAGAVLARRLRLPLIVEYNGSEAWVARHWGLGLRFPGLAAAAEEALLRDADVIVTVSAVLRDELIARGIPAGRIVTYPNGIDPGRFDPARFGPSEIAGLRARHGIPAGAVVCGFIGTFGQWHGVLVLAEAIRRLADSRPDWLIRHEVRFLMVGDGLLMPDVRRVLDSARIGSLVTLTGLVPQEEAPLHLSACDILLSPHVPNADGTRFFGSPTKLFEYMCLARGIVASGLEQIAEILQPAVRVQDAGSADLESRSRDAVAVVVTPGDSQELIDGIRLLVERPELRGRLAHNARRLVLSRYTWDHHVAAILSTVESPARTAEAVGLY
jgi:glycosyltransferase involved in cell wall biosynthesis